ncbi:ATP-binding cassette domain-containing protein [Actinoplanes bogorensis]|uniref:ATP-binding cassette domain-containing protein n=1 Tax=Paractinoplanes bogorensis TaxID=1610840 RepID=A0ABS5YM22_9ACTN|nr:ATP-binding cassette domain-containing protein [Actinoplanes bogorensis]MBU2664492.1 ATP-binding cassette domain-containing protein [Actinoplanes bogorensis]
MSAPALDLDGVTKAFDRGGRTVLRGVRLEVRPGEIVWLRGRSGTGKSTLLTIAGLLTRPDGGTVRIGGTDTRGLGERELAMTRATRLGFVFQQHNLFGHLTAIENVVLPAVGPRAGARRRAADMLAGLGLAGRTNAAARNLSGGERQRIAVARALINDPALLIADEPVSGLDLESAGQVLEQFRGAAAQGRAVLIASHDDVAGRIADRVVVLSDGRLTADTPVATPEGA